MHFEKENVLVEQNLKDKNQLFKLIAKKAFEKRICKNTEGVEKGFLKREAQGTTGFEDGFAIPHARVPEIEEPAVFVVTNNNKYQNWDSLDQNGVQYVIALLIPAESSELHMNVLSAIAQKLMDEKFRQLVKTQDSKKIFGLFNDFLRKFKIPGSEEPARDKANQNQNEQAGKKIVGVSACPAGIAHTFMAKQKMEDATKKLGYSVSWETQGANGQKSKLDQKAIQQADAVVIASDIEIDLKRFVGKKVLITSTNEAIKDPESLIKKALKVGKAYDGQKNYNRASQGLVKSFFGSYKKAFQSNFGKPWSYLFITASLVAIISLVGFSFFGDDWATNGSENNMVLFQMQEIAKFALYLSMPFMAASVAKTMTKKHEAFIITFIAAFLINMPQIQVTFNAVTGYDNSQVGSVSVFYDWNGLIPQVNQGSNIIGAVVATFVTVLVVNGFYKVSNHLGSGKSAGFIRTNWVFRILPTAIVLFVVVFLLGLPLAYVSSKLNWLLFDYGSAHWIIRFLIGGLFGVLIALDLGGFVNKTTLIALVGLAQYDLRFTAIISIGIPICSLGFGTTFHFLQNKFKEEDKADASTSFQKGMQGISEGPLHSLNKYGWRVQIPNLVSSFVSTGVALVLGFYVISGGLLNILFLGGQAHLALPNDITFLNYLLPRDAGLLTMLCSFIYGILGYYLCVFLGCVSYLGVSWVTFSVPGPKRVFR